MPRHSRSDPISSESESDDAPESISLLQSKKDTQRLEAERRDADVIQRRAKKEKNREMDRKLKERAVMNERAVGKAKDRGNKKKKEKESDETRDPGVLEERMQRAMEEAELESDGEEFTGIRKDEDAAQDDDDDDDDETTVRHPDHLPDELFAAAFSSSLKRKKIGVDTTLSSPEKKQKSSEKRDIVVGSRAIRILPNSSAPPVPSTTPPRKVKRFVDRALSLKNAKQNLHTKGWERRPVNIGVLKRDGPPVAFVRKK